MAFSRHPFFAKNLHLFFFKGEKPELAGGWTNPFEKYARQIGFIFPKLIGVKIKNMSNHHKPIWGWLPWLFGMLTKLFGMTKLFTSTEDFHCNIYRWQTWTSFNPLSKPSIKETSPLGSLSVTGLVDSCTEKISLTSCFFFGRKPIGWKGTLMTHRVTAHVCEVESTVWLSYI